MPKQTKQTSVNLTLATIAQADELRRRGYGTMTTVIRVAIDRMYQAEVKGLGANYQKQDATQDA